MINGTSIDVDFPGFRPESVLQTVNDLRRETTTDKIDSVSTILVTGNQTALDGNGSLYVWSANSTAVDDGLKVIAPFFTTVGRWLNIYMNAPGTVVNGMGTSTTVAPSQAAIKTYVDTGDAANSAALTAYETSLTANTGGGLIGTTTGQTVNTRFAGIDSTITTLQFGRLINVRTITSTGTYIPTTGTKALVVEAVGGGGAGSGSVTTTSGQQAWGQGGAAGTYAKVYITSGFSSVGVTIGANGAGTAGGSGSAGTATSFGTFLTCPGGAGGIAAVASTSFGWGPFNVGPATATISGAVPLLVIPGEYGGGGYSSAASVTPAGGKGGNTPLGNGGPMINSNLGAAIAGSGYGSGGGGAVSPTSQATTKPGGSGAPGVVIVYEFG